MRKFRNCCAVSTESDGVQSVEITIERYEQLLEAEAKLNVIRDIAASEDRAYGYGSDISKTIDVILGIERDEK